MMLQLTRGEALLLCAALEEGWLDQEEDTHKAVASLNLKVEDVIKRDTATLLPKLRSLTPEKVPELLAAVKRFRESAHEPVDERLRKAGLIGL